jgi:hypothetical protein
VGAELLTLPDVLTTAGSAFMDAWGLVRVIVALPLVLVLPGLALSAAVFPERSLGTAERVATSLGVSLAVTALGGIALNWTPWGLQSGSWALLLGGVTLTASVLALLRRRRRSFGAAGRLSGRPDIRQSLLLGLALILAAGAVALARHGAAQQDVAGFTQLWILPSEQLDQRTVRLGLRSAEIQDSTYRLRVLVGHRVVREWRSIPLAPGQQWETTTVLPREDTSPRPVVGLLYRLDAPQQVYRSVILWRGPPTE